MINLYKRKLEKIYKKIDSIATKGSDYALEYYKYIDELLSKGDYAELEQVLVTYYNIDIVDATDVAEVKKKTWKPVLFQTSSPFLKKLGNLYKKKGVYQNSFDIFTIDPSNKIGEIYEVDTYTASTRYYLQNQEFARRIGDEVYYLEVFDLSGEVTLIDTHNPSLSFDQNLLNRYEIALDILISNI